MNTRFRSAAKRTCPLAKNKVAHWYSVSGSVIGASGRPSTFDIRLMTSICIDPISSRVGHVQPSTNSKPITPPVNPEAHEIPHGVPNFRVFPIEVRLL